MQGATRVNNRFPHIETSQLICSATQFASLYMMGKSVVNEFMTESISYRNQYTDCKSLDWFLYDRGLRHERVNGFKIF